MTIENILVVDDSMSSRLVLRKMLQEYNVNVEMVGSVKEALERLMSSKPDAIFMDHLMPGIDGLQALKLLKENADTATIPVVMFTALDDQTYLETISRHGAVGVLPKPFSDEALFSIMQKLRAIAEQPEQTAESTLASQGAALPLVESDIEPIVKSTVDRLIEEQLLPAVDDKLSALQQRLTALINKHQTVPSPSIAELSDDIDQAVTSILATELNNAVSGVTAELNQTLTQRLEQHRLEQETRAQQQLDALEQRFSARFDEIEQRLQTQQQQYDMLDPIVAENTQSSWYDSVEQLSAEIGNSDLSRPATPTLLQADDKIKYAALGLIAVAIVIGLFFIYRSLAT